MKLHINFLIIFAFLLNFNIKAQNELNLTRHSANIGLGIATPLLNLKSTNSNDSFSGFAKRGFSFGMLYRLAFNNGLALYAQYSHAQMPIDVNALNKSALEDINSNGTTLENMKTEGYKINAISFGLSYVFLKNKKFQIMPKLGIGFGQCQNRFVDATYKNGIFTGRWTFMSDKKTSGNLNFGIDFSYKIAEKLSLFLVRDTYIHAPEFDYDDNFQFATIFNDRKQYKRVYPMLHRSSLIGLRINL